MSEVKEKRPRGRPRQFDKEVALKRALDLFRRKGYDETSIEDITTELNINRPSLYAAFGTKEELFTQVLGAYISGPVAYVNEVINEPTTRELVKKLLGNSVDVLFYNYNEKPKGCLAIMSTASGELEKVGIQQHIVKSLQDNLHKLAERFERAKLEGDLPDNVDPLKLANYISTIHKGLSLQVINGATRTEMQMLVEQVLDLWPSKK